MRRATRRAAESGATSPGLERPSCRRLEPRWPAAAATASAAAACPAPVSARLRCLTSSLHPPRPAGAAACGRNRHIFVSFRSIFCNAGMRAFRELVPAPARTAPARWARRRRWASWRGTKPCQFVVPLPGCISATFSEKEQQFKRKEQKLPRPKVAQQWGRASFWRLRPL